MITPTFDKRSGENFSFQAWREQFLRLILRGAVIFGLATLIPTLLTNTEPIFFILYGIAYLVLIIIAFVPLPYLLKAWTFIALFYLLGVGGIFDTGIWGDSRVFFVAAAAITSMLISPRAGIWAAFFTILTSVLGGWFVLTGRIQLSTQGIWAGNLATWVSGIALILMLDAIFIIGLNLLLKEFTRAQEQASRSLKDLDAERQLLEQRVANRTRESLHKTTQLEAAAYVARKITSTGDLQALLTDIARTVAEQFRLYHVGIFLLDESSQNAVLQAASSHGGARMLEAGHRLKVGSQGIVGYVTDRGKPRIALDVGADAFFLKNPFLPQTRSEMTLPLIAREKVIGALDVQSELPQAFSESDIEIMQTLADQLATAIENARLISESQFAISQYEAINTLLTPQLWSKFLKGRKHAYQYRPTGLRPYTGSDLDIDEGTLQIPITLRGQEIGMINLHRKPSAPAWGNRERGLASEVAAQVALALENARLLEETTHRAEVERMTAEISTRIGSSTLYESIIKTAAEELSRALGGPEVLVQIQPAQPQASGNGSSNGGIKA
jgi:GAF domain-containing protein